MKADLVGESRLLKFLFTSFVHVFMTLQRR
jgi:hypothetical protein